MIGGRERKGHVGPRNWNPPSFPHPLWGSGEGGNKEIPLGGHPRGCIVRPGENRRREKEKKRWWYDQIRINEVFNAGVVS